SNRSWASARASICRLASSATSPGSISTRIERMSISRRIAETISSLHFELLPPPVVRACKDLCLDTLGAGLAGTSAQGMSDFVRFAAEHFGTGPATIFGHALKLPVHETALINATLAHARELD